MYALPYRPPLAAGADLTPLIPTLPCTQEVERGGGGIEKAWASEERLAQAASTIDFGLGAETDQERVLARCLLIAFNQQQTLSVGFTAKQ